MLFFPRKATVWKRNQEDGVGLRLPGRHQGSSDLGGAVREKGARNTRQGRTAGEQGWELEMLGNLLKGWSDGGGRRKGKKGFWVQNLGLL